MNSGFPLGASRSDSGDPSQPGLRKVDPERWTRILKSIRNEVNEYTFRAWYEPLECMGLDDRNILVVQGPDNFFVDWFTENCIGPLERSVWAEWPELEGVRIEAAPEPPARVDQEPAPPVVSSHPEPRRAAVSPESVGLRPQ